MKKLLLNDRFILLVILINSVIIYIQESGINSALISAIDVICIAIFILEMAVKQREYGFKEYWKNPWNIMDGTLVILSIPALLSYFLPAQLLDLSVLLILRMLRIFRFFRVIHIFPNLGTIMKNFWKAVKDSLPILIGFFVLVIIFAMISCAMFKTASPEYFGTPKDAIYSIFQLCTASDFDIPDALANSLSASQMVWIRVYFILILIAGGIFGLNLLNSIFVDAMVSDNTDSVAEKINELTNTVAELKQEIIRLQK